ncbi:MAG: [FeFe] hydrogenase H-cluster radical SAM maturase HydE [Phycisphaerales bacterium]|nr:MAG: [FeFe] hydrogenase H-cluster radical SAM maturase HydE [Phycisphaerales bacterium]
MSVLHTQAVLERVFAAKRPQRGDVETLLRLDDERDTSLLFDFADDVRRRFVGAGVLLRGIIEFSSFCRNACAYCGLSRTNTQLRRYRLTDAEILAAAENICEAGIRTIVLQSGEEDNLDADWLSQMIAEVKARFDVAITLSVGERRRDEYALWREAGADRYLLKMETSDAALYESLHPGMSFENRMRCLRDLGELGYQTGTGNLVGLKGQTVESLAEDILFFKEGDFDMLSVSPFIPHAQTPLAAEPTGDLEMTLKMTALTRIVSGNAHIPATTAIGSLAGRDERPKALRAGANVLMPNFTPTPYRRQYEIYPNKRCVDENAGACPMCMAGMVAALGRWVDYGRGDSLKRSDADLVQAQRD